eukprot:TRINITY_DN858_c0_g3_i1.p1 TRINITY_DN858_c0_g3~~TRINITY_DN858_c0_g3_i1.p1  ORF type:complete len:320 (+),score=32.16 TRINITY_DN858_c0_g3_i1:107-1066(+)
MCTVNGIMSVEPMNQLAEALIAEMVEEEVKKREHSDNLCVELWELAIKHMVDDKLLSLSQRLSRVTYESAMLEHENHTWQQLKGKYKIVHDDEVLLASAGMDGQESSKFDESVAPNSVIKLRRRDYSTLSGHNWVNDEVINAYLKLIIHRTNMMYGMQSAFAFGTHFFMKLIHSECDFSAVSRWTKKVDIFSYTILVLPCNLTNHWGLTVVDFGQGTVAYFDSLGLAGDDVVDVLIDYLSYEYFQRKGSPKDFSYLKRIVPTDIPIQENSYDCGVFVCQYCNCLLSYRGMQFPFNQSDIPYLRRRMGIELIVGKVPLPP